jgi:glycine/D-amino acid oxidase-like deaminating enzyme
MSGAPDCDVAIVGGGLAGAATAFFLSRARDVRVAVVEQERAPALHSSGRNAGLVRGASGDPELDALGREGAEFLRAPPDDFPGPRPFRRTGSYLLVARRDAPRHAVAGARLADVEEAARAVPGFRPDRALVAIRSDDDGVADGRVVVAGLLEGARARGAVVRFGDAVAAVATEGGAVSGLRLRDGTSLAARVVVDAAGAWAGPIAATAGADDPGLAPVRRHLLVTVPDPRVDPAWPWIWDTVNGFYFRPESGGLLMCACDESVDVPGDCATEPAAIAAISEKARRFLPEFAGLAAARAWAGHRTRRASGRFVLGEDARRRGLIWAAGLGGHGLTCAASVGRRVADAALARLRGGADEADGSSGAVAAGA